jgi:thiamine-monophosphate kinase
VSEADRIAMLARVLSMGGHATGVATGIGDDAAVLDLSSRPPGHGRLVWTVDEQVEGTHFRRDLASWNDVGWRSVMAAASDLAAMGASPWGALASAVVPSDVDDAALEAFAHGQRAAADVIGAPVVGGNLARGPVFSVATTFLGTCEAPVLRRGACAGDGVWMAGAVGLAAAGLASLERRARSGAANEPPDSATDAAVEAWRRPRALLASGRAMRSVAHAAIDVSDGLAGDAGHVAAASGVQIVIDASALRDDASLVRAASALNADALDLALYGGEDYAIVAASPVAIEGFRCIGAVVPGAGVALRDASGVRALAPRGYDHFTSGKP